MMLSLALLLALQTQVPPSATPSDNGDPPGRVARLSVRDGRLSFQPSGDTAAGSWTDVGVNYILTSADRLYAVQDSRAELQPADYTVAPRAPTPLPHPHLTQHFL